MQHQTLKNRPANRHGITSWLAAEVQHTVQPCCLSTRAYNPVGIDEEQSPVADQPNNTALTKWQSNHPTAH